MHFHVLGPLEARTARGVPIELSARKPATLLAVLLLNANASVSIDHLIAAIWHEQDAPTSAVRNLRSYVCRLRAVFGDRLESHPGGYRLHVLPGELDTDQVETLAAAARLAIADGAHSTAAGQLAEALALWRGRPFHGLTFDAARAEATRLDELRRELRELTAETWLELGRHAEAVALLRELVDEDPLREGTWARLVRALHQAGRPADALATYDRARRVIIRELGVQPGKELVAAGQGNGGPIMNTAQSGGLTLVAGGGPVLGNTGIDALLASAVEDVVVMSASGGVGSIGAFRRIDRVNLRRGVRYRVLFPDSVRLSGQLGGFARAGAEVRTDIEVPMEAVVVDGVIALLPMDHGAGVAVFRQPSVVAATMALFERIWPAAVPLIPSAPEGAVSDASVPTCRERDLLTLLCAGCTDESAAARLGVSVRTVRRMVADLMNRLGARSRFQAGAKAADRGWLMDRAS